MSRAPDPRGHRIPPGLDRETTHARGRRGVTATRPRSRSLPFAAPQTRGAPPRHRAAGSPQRPATPQDARGDTAPPARAPPTAGPLPPGRQSAWQAELRRRHRRRAPPGTESASRAPEACRTARPTATATALPGTAAAASHLRSPFRGHAPGQKAYGAEPGSTARSPRFHAETGQGSAPAAARTPSAPHAAGKGDGEATGRARDGTAGGGQRAPSGRPSPRGTLAERRRRRSGPGSPALAGLQRRRDRRALHLGRQAVRAGGRGRRPAPPVRPRREGRRGERRGSARRGAAREPAAAAKGERSGPWQPHGPAAAEGRRARALRHRRPLRSERAGPAADRANTVPSAETGPQRGGGRAPLPGTAARARTRRSHDDDDDDDEHGRPRRSPPQGIGGRRSLPPPMAPPPPPGTRRRRRRRRRRRLRRGAPSRPSL